MIFSLKINDIIIVTRNICSLSKISMDKKNKDFYFYINLMDGNGHKVIFKDEVSAQKARLKVVRAVNIYTTQFFGGNHGRVAR